MNKAELQKQSAEDVREVQELMKAKNIRVEARQRINTETGFIDFVVIFISEKKLEDVIEPPVLVDTTESTEPHVG